MAKKCIFYNRDQLFQLIFSRDSAVDTAIKILYACFDTDLDNMSRDIKKSVKYYNDWIVSGKNLSGRHLDNARKICLEQIDQLAEFEVRRFKKIEQNQLRNVYGDGI